MPTPIYNLTEWAASQSAPWVPHNAALRALEAAARGSVSDRDLAAPPGACADGAAYLVGAAATGAWAGYDGKMAVAVGANAANGWIMLTIATPGQLLWIEDEGIRVQYVSGAWQLLADASTLSWKQAVRAATTAAGTLASDFENGDTVDGVVLATGDRILIKNQAAPAENGIYVVAAAGAPVRASDADAGGELVNATVYVSEGATQADTQWTCTTNAPINLGMTGLAFAQSGSGGLAAASVAETNAGTEAGKAVTPDGLAGSRFGTAVISILVSDPNGAAITAGDGKAYWRVPSTLNGMDLVGVAAALTTTSSSGAPSVQVHNVTQAADMLTTPVTIDAGETDSSTAATPPVIDGANDDVATADLLRFDIDAAGTGAKGLMVELQFRLP